MIATIDRSQSYIFCVDEVLSKEECSGLIERIEESGLEAAPVITPYGERVKTWMRNNERVIFDDLELAKTLLEQLKPKIPQVMHGMRLVGMNERFRGYRYRVGMRFAPHADNAFERNEQEQSFTRSWSISTTTLKAGKQRSLWSRRLRSSRRQGWRCCFSTRSFMRGRW